VITFAFFSSPVLVSSLAFLLLISRCRSSTWSCLAIRTRSAGINRVVNESKLCACVHVRDCALHIVWSCPPVCVVIPVVRTGSQESASGRRAAVCSVVCSSLRKTPVDRVLFRTRVRAFCRMAARRDRREVCRRSRGVPYPVNTMFEALSTGLIGVAPFDRATATRSRLAPRGRALQAAP